MIETKRVSQSIDRAIAGLIIAYIVLWSLALSLTHRGLPVDVVEGLVWGREWLIGTVKHPPLLSWILEIVWQLGGVNGVYVLSAVAPALCLFFVFLLSKRFVDPQKAFLSSALLLGVVYFFLFVAKFNHNTAQLPLSALVLLLFECCLSKKHLVYWLALGVTAVLLVLTKYTSLFLLVCIPLWLCFDQEARKNLRSPGPWASLFVFLLLLTPHILFFINNHSFLFDYINMRAHKGHSGLWFLLTKLWFHVPMILVLAFTGLLGRGSLSINRPLMREDRFLLFFAFVPLILFIVSLSILGLGFLSAWGAPFFVLSGLVAMRFFGNRVNPIRFRRALYGVLVLLVLAPMVHTVQVLTRPYFYSFFNLAPQKAHIPDREISRKVEAAFEQKTGKKPKLLVGRLDEAGRAALFIDPRPQVIYHDSWRNTFWIEASTICQASAVLWRGEAFLLQSQRWLIKRCGIKNPPVVHLKIPYPDFPELAPIDLQMIILARD